MRINTPNIKERMEAAGRIKETIASLPPADFGPCQYCGKTGTDMFVGGPKLEPAHWRCHAERHPEQYRPGVLDGTLEKQPAEEDSLASANL